MKHTITLLLMILFAAVGKAQTKTTIAFLPMSYDEESISGSEAKVVQETVMNAFVASRRFTVVDRNKLEELEKEKSLQRTESFLDSQDGFTDGLSKGANYLVDGNIMDIRHVENKEKWNSTILVQLRMLDVSTGEIMATGTVNAEYIPESALVKKAMKSHFSKDEVKALEAKEEMLQASKDHQKAAFALALLRLTENVNRFTGSILPLHADVIKWDTKKNELVLGAGSSMGVQAGQIADVVKFSDVTIGDQEMRRSEVIGSAWIVRVDDQNFSVATIIDNLKSILKISKTDEKIGIIIR